MVRGFKQLVRFGKYVFAHRLDIKVSLASAAAVYQVRMPKAVQDASCRSTSTRSAWNAFAHAASRDC